MEAIDLRSRAQHVHLSHLREVVTGEVCIACIRHVDTPNAKLDKTLHKQDLTTNFLPSVLPHPVGFHRYESRLPARSLERRAQLTLGGDKPVIPGVAFIR